MRDVLSNEDREEKTIQDSDLVEKIKSAKRNLKKVYNSLEVTSDRFLYNFLIIIQVPERAMAPEMQEKSIHQLIVDEIRTKLAAKQSTAAQVENVADGSDSENTVENVEDGSDSQDSEFEKIVRLRYKSQNCWSKTQKRWD